MLHYGRAGTGERLVEGMTFTIEPMINAGRREVRELADGWTIVTKDHSLSAQWEHTVVVTADGCEIITRFPAEDLVIAGRPYFTAGGSLALERDPQSNRNTVLDDEAQEAMPRATDSTAATIPS